MTTRDLMMGSAGTVMTERVQSISDRQARSWNSDSRRLNVVMCVASFLPMPEGGAEKQCRLLATELVQRGHHVTVVTRWLGKGALRKELLDGVVVRRLGYGHPISGLVRKVGAFLRARRGRRSQKAASSGAVERRLPITAPLL